jgi:hypothetical protein
VQLLALWGALAAIDGLGMLRVQGLRQLWQDWGALRHPALSQCNNYHYGASK